MVQLIYVATAMALALLLAAVLPASRTHAAQTSEAHDADTYTVQIGDTLFGIAQRNGIDLESLMRLNHLSDPDTIFVGAVLRLPTGAALSQPGAGAPLPVKEATTRVVGQLGPAPQLAVQQPAASQPPAPAPQAPSGNPGRAPVLYTVLPGDTLMTVARRFGTTPSALVDANGLPPGSLLTTGQTLMLVGDPTVSLAAAARSSSAPAAMAPAPAMSAMPAGAAPAFASSPAFPANQTGSIRARSEMGAPMAFRAPTAGSMAALDDIPRNAIMAGAPRSIDIAPNLRPSPNPQALAVAQIAMQYAGAPYVFGGDSPAGFDCSGFMQFVQRQAGRQMPRDLLGQYLSGIHPIGPLEPGDLVFFQDTYMPGLSHNGIYIGNGQFIHAISEESGVGISNLNEPYYAERWYGATRPQ